jgi:hypothetical protein
LRFTFHPRRARTYSSDPDSAFHYTGVGIQYPTMAEFFRYYSSFQNLRGGFGGVPSWARFIVGIFAIPGIVLAGLSLVLFIVSILALLLLTLPVYRLLQIVTGGRVKTPEPNLGGSLFDPQASPGRKQVDVRVVE